MGHERFTPFATMLAKHPERVIEKAVYGMLPKTALGRQMLRRKLRVYRERQSPARRAAAEGARPQRRARQVMADSATTHTIGRRKEAVCRLYIKPGSGKWDVNGRTLGDYFPRPAHVSAIQQPFTATDTLGRFDVKAKRRRRRTDADRPARFVSLLPARSSRSTSRTAASCATSAS